MASPRRARLQSSGEAPRLGDKPEEPLRAGPLHPAGRSAARAGEKVESRAKLTQVMVDSIFSFGELGFQEIETSRYVTGILEENGFTLEGYAPHAAIKAPIAV